MTATARARPDLTTWSHPPADRQARARAQPAKPAAIRSGPGQIRCHAAREASTKTAINTSYLERFLTRVATNPALLASA
jgi:hypothetical protein